MAVLRNSTASRNSRLPISATHVHKLVAMRKDSGTAMNAIATSCLIAASVPRPSRKPPTVFHNAAQMRAMPPRPGSAACSRRCLYSVLSGWRGGSMGERLRGRQPPQHVLRHIEIGVDLLHVVRFFKRVDHAQELLPGLLVDRHLGPRPPHDLNAARLAEARLERLGDLMQLIGIAVDDVSLLARFAVVGAGVDRRLQHLIRSCLGGIELDGAELVEIEGDGAGLAEV